MSFASASISSTATLTKEDSSVERQSKPSNHSQLWSVVSVGNTARQTYRQHAVVQTQLGIVVRENGLNEQRVCNLEIDRSYLHGLAQTSGRFINHYGPLKMNEGA